MTDAVNQYSEEDLSDLRLSQDLRRNIIKSIGQGSMNDPEMLNVALSSAKAMDQQILTRRRINADVESANSSRAVTDRMTELLKMVAAGRGTGVTTPSLGTAGIDDASIDTVPGQMDIGAIELDITDLDPNKEG